MRLLRIGDWRAWLTNWPRLVTHSVRATLYRAPVEKLKGADYLISGGVRALGTIRTQRWLVLGAETQAQACQEAAGCVGLPADRREVVRVALCLRAGLYAGPGDVVEYQEAMA